MFAALRVGLTGLRANQRYLDIIGNNLTNSETAGFKADRLTFSDVLYSTTRQATGPSASVGGVNARQFGVGVQVASIDQLERQGSLIDTGRTFDLALQGQGFFVLSNGNERLFSRVGSFALDRDSNLVDSRTGFHVQDTSGGQIQIDTEAIAPAKPSSFVTFSGNLPAEVTGPLAEIQRSSKAFEEHIEARYTTPNIAGSLGALQNKTISITVDAGNAVSLTLPATLTSVQDVVDAIDAAFATKSPKVMAQDVGGALELTSPTSGTRSRIQIGASDPAVQTAFGMSGATAVINGTENPVTATTRLSDLNSNKVDYVAGDQIDIAGVDSLGQTVNATFTLTTGNETIDDLRLFIASQLPNAQVNLTSDGRLEIVADDTGPNPMAITISDGLNTSGSPSTGSSNFSAYSFAVDQEGTGPDTRDTSITVFDSLGISHTLSGRFERQDDGTWNLDLTVPDDEGLAVGGLITGITFGPDGTYQGAASNSIDLTWLNGANPQTVSIDFGEIGNLSGLTQFGRESSAQASSQDGYESGTLSSLGVTAAGTIQGFYSNGAIIDLDQVGVAVFRNNAGLIREGSTLFRASDNSGIPLVGQAGVGGAGNIVAGALEGSNVDTAEEFVRLIEAQRSFQGSARIVTTADEIFAELLQIV